MPAGTLCTPTASARSGGSSRACRARAKGCAQRRGCLGSGRGAEWGKGLVAEGRAGASTQEGTGPWAPSDTGSQGGAGKGGWLPLGACTQRPCCSFGGGIPSSRGHRGGTAAPSHAVTPSPSRLRDWHSLCFVLPMGPSPATAITNPGCCHQSPGHHQGAGTATAEPSGPHHPPQDAAALWLLAGAQP